MLDVFDIFEFAGKKGGTVEIFSKNRNVLFHISQCKRIKFVLVLWKQGMMKNYKQKDDA